MTESVSGNAAFSLRMLQLEDYQNLQSVANIRKVSVAQLSRTFILEGISRFLEDPAEIERLYDAEKQRLLQAGAELRGDAPCSG